MEHEERAQRLVRRIESFSDLVIGFSLALLGLTLKIPPDITELIAHPWWLIAYAWTFAVISALWFQHQRLFSHFFTPARATITLNFLALGMIGLIVFFVQVFVQYHDELSKVWASLAYFAALGATLVVFGFLNAHGVRARWERLDADLRFVGVRNALRGIISGACMLVGVAICALHGATDMRGVLPLVLLAGAGLVISRVTARVVKPRVLAGSRA